MEYDADWAAIVPGTFRQHDFRIGDTILSQIIGVVQQAWVLVQFSFRDHLVGLVDGRIKQTMTREDWIKDLGCFVLLFHRQC